MTTTGVILIKDHTLKGNAEHSVHIAQLGKQVHRGERTVLKVCDRDQNSKILHLRPVLFLPHHIFFGMLGSGSGSSYRY